MGCLEILRSPTSRTRQLSSGSIARDQIARMKQEKRECREADHAREVGTPTSMSIIVVSAAPRFGGRGLGRIFPVLAPGLSSNATRSVLEPSATPKSMAGVNLAKVRVGLRSPATKRGEGYSGTRPEGRQFGALQH